MKTRIFKAVRKRGRGLFLLITFLGLALFTAAGDAWAAARGTLVFFHANWCASCRDVLPIVREVAEQNNLDVVQIDVDSQNAPQQARHFGLSMPTEEPPQVYCMNRGRATLVYNGKNFRSGGASSARATLLQNLQQLLPPQP